jgi:hypothetical protein
MTSMAYASNKITPLETYILDKIHMMQDPRGFNLKLTESEIKHMKSLKNELQVDNYARDLFRKKL